MNPTKQQINQAERLQGAGLCQMADRCIWKHNPSGEYFFSNNAKDGENWKCIELTGPFPTFEEALVDFKPIFDIVDNARDGLQFLIHSHGVTLGFWKLDIIGEWKWLDGFTITTAIIEALLLLKGEG